MRKARLLVSWTIGLTIGLSAVLLAVVLGASPGRAQGNIDRGKTPAQMFADTCAGCHRNPRALKRGSAGFLRLHYTTSSAQASAIAAYLATAPSAPEEPAQQARQQTKQQQPNARPTDHVEGAPASNGDRLADAATARPTPVIAGRPAASALQAKPVLEPFEE
jgi:hypothetical protein